MTQGKTTKMMQLLHPFFSLGLSLHENNFGSPEELQKNVLDLREQFLAKILHSGYVLNDANNALYAVFSFLDERILLHSRFNLEWFEYRLMVKVFEDANAGEKFFQTAQQLAENKKNKDVLEVFVYCMMLGFKGKYQLEEESSFLQVRDALAKACGMESAPELAELAPNARKEPGALPREKTGRNYLLAGAVLFGLSVLTYIALVIYSQLVQ